MLSLFAPKVILEHSSDPGEVGILPVTCRIYHIHTEKQLMFGLVPVLFDWVCGQSSLHQSRIEVSLHPGGCNLL